MKDILKKILRQTKIISLGNPYRAYPQIPLKKREDDDDNNIRTSSISSTSVPLTDQEQHLSTNSSDNVKVNLNSNIIT